MSNTKTGFKYPKVSIIIPLYKSSPYFFESIKKCLELDYPDFEILIGVDKMIKVKFQDKHIKILKTGMQRTGPAEKRDIGIVKAKGEIIAFLDDDSYPDKEWLKRAVEILRTKQISAVCGPGLTPPGDSFWQKVTGSILSSRFGSGPYRYRFVCDSPRFVDDYPAYNMIVKRDVLIKVGGFGTKYYGGEDTAICIKLINAGERIFYHPDIMVFHHRREFPFEYGRQVANVGLHRGYFVKTHPQTSLRLSYFSPAIVISLFFIILISAFFDRFLILPLLLFFLGGYVVIFVEGLSRFPLYINFLLPLAVFYNHFTYAINFLKGLILVKKLER